jgi:hypothetical protein
MNLETFASGKLNASERAALETHLERCLACAEELERRTRAQLDLLVGRLGSGQTIQAEAHPALERIMRSASESVGSFLAPDPDRLLGSLAPPTAEGAVAAFAGYDVLAVIGRGGMGVVLKAQDRTLDRVVALTILFPVELGDAAFATRFLDEARALAAIENDHVMPVYQAGIEEGWPFLVMPFYPEGTLAQQLKQQPRFAPADVARVGLQLARALAATHARGLLHRDLKPSNVLLEQGLRRVRLADFGLAQAHIVGAAAPATGGDVAPPRAIAGTPHYMAPEQTRGAAIDVRSDLFGLGAVMFQLATGRTLYEGESADEVLSAAARCALLPIRQFAPLIPYRLAGIIDRLLAEKPEDRFATAPEVVAKLEPLVEGEHRLRRWLTRAAGAVLVACLAVSVTVVALDRSGQTRIINTLLCQRTGDTYYLRGRFGTYAWLPEVVAAARPYDVIEARFSNERLVGSFRVGGKPLTIRAAAGFTPILVATNNGQPLMLVDAPLTLEGLTIWRRGPRVNFAPLISVEKAPLHLLNCRIIRSRFQGQDILVWGRLRVLALNEAQALPLYRALLAFQHGSVGFLRNCVVAGTQATAFGVRASTNQPTRIEAENCLFVTDRTLAMRPDTMTRLDLRVARSVLVTSALLDLDETGPVSGITASWEDCLVDRKQGALVRVNQSHGGALLRALEWKETNVVYAGPGTFAVNRRGGQLDAEAEWNALLRLPEQSHRIIDRQVFPPTCVRSTLTLHATDLDPQIVQAGTAGSRGLATQFVGEGKPGAAFRKNAAYREWQKQVSASTSEWEKRRAAPPVDAR